MIPIECSAQPLDVCFHPFNPYLLAAALVDGTVEVHQVPTTQQQERNKNDDDEDTLLSSTTIVLASDKHPPPSSVNNKNSNNNNSSHSDDEDKNKRSNRSCHCLTFSQDGQYLYVGSSDGSIACLSTTVVAQFSLDTSLTDNAIVWKVSTESPVYVLQCVPQQQRKQERNDDPLLLLSGHEDGSLMVWNVTPTTTTTTTISSSNACNNNSTRMARWQHHEDYLSDITIVDHRMVLTTSADGTLGVYDLQQNPDQNSKQLLKGLVRRSDPQDDELLSVVVMKHNKKVVCGGATGVLHVFSFGTWGDVSDRFPGHPHSVESLLVWDADTLLTGSGDGLIRVVTIHPDQFLGVLGSSGEHGFPIEKLCWNANRNHVGCVSHDTVVRLFDTAILRDDDDAQADEKEESDNDTKPAAKSEKAAATTREEEQDGSESSDDADNDTASSSDSDDNNKPAKKRGKRLKTRNEEFFADL